MSLKIFRCRCCGARVEYGAASCPVCNRLVSNDHAKRCIIIIGVAVFLIAVAGVILLMH